MILLLVVLVIFVGITAWAGITAVEEQQTRQRREVLDLEDRIDFERGQGHD